MAEHIEIVIPCYNEEACIEMVCSAVCDVAQTLKEYTISILFIDDGSRDGTLKKIKEVARSANIEIHFISFSRNFGKEAAIYAGLSSSQADYIALMDADLQHPPELLVEMIQGIKEGYECCGARRINRKGEALVRSSFSKMFYQVVNKATGIHMEQGTTDYRFMSRKFVDAVLSLSEKNRFTKGIFAWVGFETKWIEYENVERVAGQTKWSFKGLVHYALNGYLSFAVTPLRLAVYLGFLVMLFALGYGGYIFVRTITTHSSGSGYASLMVTILFLGGIIILLLGVIGEYLARIYMEVKQRPMFISKEAKLDSDEEDKG